MGFSIKEIEYLASNKRNSWEKYRIKAKLRDVATMLTHINASDKVDEFKEELIAIYNIMLELSLKIALERK